MNDFCRRTTRRRTTRRMKHRLAMAVVLVLAALTPLALGSSVSPPTALPHAAADPAPTPVVSSSSSSIARNVVSSPLGGWQAVIKNAGSATAQQLLISSGGSWSTIAPPTTSAAIRSIAISDSGELYAIATNTSVGYYAPTDFWKYTGSGWSSVKTIATFSPQSDSGAGAILTDNSTLVMVEAATGRMFKSGDDGANWSTGQSLPIGYSYIRSTAVLIGGVVHILNQTGSLSCQYVRWIVSSGAVGTVSAPPVFPTYQCSTWLFAAPGNTSALYIAAQDRSGGMWTYKTLTGGDVWVTMVSNDAPPTELGSPLGFTMSSDGLVEVVGSRYAGGQATITRASHPAERSGNWSAVSSLAALTATSATGLALWSPQRSDGVYPAGERVWVSVPNGTSANDYYYLTSAGGVLAPLPTTTITPAGAVVRGNLSTQYAVAISPGRAWQAAIVTDLTTNAQSVLRSQDGGSWQLLPSPAPYPLSTIAVADSGVVYVEGRSSAGCYYCSTDFYRIVGKRWYGPITYDYLSSAQFAGPGQLIRNGNDLIGFEADSGRINYSTDDGNTWSTYPSLSIGAPQQLSVSGDLISAVTGTHYARWSRTYRAEVSTATAPAIPSGATTRLLPNRAQPGDLWLAYAYSNTTTSFIGLAHSTDAGTNWTTVDPGSSPPSGYGYDISASMNLGLDGRLYAFLRDSTSGGLYRASRALGATPNWTAPTLLTTMWPNPSTVSPQPSQAPSNQPPDVWMMHLTSSSTNPWTWDLQHYGTVGAPVSIPDGQTYGPSSVPSYFAMRPTTAMSDPVSSATGTFTTQATDVALPAIGEPLTMTRTYNSADSTVGRLGSGWTDSFAVGLSLTAGGATLRAGDGQQVGFTLNSDGTYSGSAGALASLVKNGDGSYSVTTKARQRYSFDSGGRLTAISNRNAMGLVLAYDTAGNLTTVSGSGRSLTLAYSAGRLASVTLADGRHVDYSYTSGLLTDVRDLGGKHTLYGYNASGLLTSIQDANGHYVVRNAYDAATGRVTDQYDARNNHTTFSWDAGSQTTTMTAPDGGVTRDSYSGNVLVKHTDPVGNVTRLSYDADLRLAGLTDPLGNTSALSYDSHGNITSELDADGASSTYTYNSLDEQTSSTNARGTKATTSYDSAGNLTGTSIANPNGGTITTSNTYDPTTGLLTSSTNARGKTTVYGHGSHGELTSVTDPLGNKTSFGYDSSGRHTSTVSPRGNVAGANATAYTTTYTYDDADELTQVSDPLNHATSFTYDDVGARLTTEDANHHITTLAYTPTNQIASVQSPDAAIPATTFGYDANDRLVSLSRPYSGGTLTSSYGYDGAGQLTSASTPTGAWSYTYTAAGDLATSTDPAGNTITTSYDPQHRPLAVSYSDGTPAVSYTYNATGNRTSMTDGLGTIRYSYDGLDRLTRATRGTQSFSYGYDASGAVTSRTYPGQPADSYGFDDDGRLTTLSSNGATIASYTYDPDSNPLTTTFPAGNGYVESRGYDNADRLVDIADAAGTTTLTRAGYTLDPVGNPTAIVDASGATNTYQYDLLNRLTRACLGTTTCAGATDYLAWTYDGMGNRTTESRPTGTTTYSYNGKNQLTATSGPGGTTSYGYDLDGNQVSAGGRTTSFNAAGKATSSTAGGTTTTYSYDGNGRRTSETTGLATTQLVWDPISYQLAEEQDGTGATLRRFTYGNGLVSMSQTGTTGGPFYYHVNGQGSVLALTNAAGTTQWTYGYQPYGLASATKLDPAAPTNPMGWIGQYTAAGSATTLLRARSYDPLTGRFTSPDPAGTGDLYGYGNDNPLVYSDPNGTDPYDVFDNGLNPEGGELVKAEQMACDAGLPCNVQEMAASLYGGHQAAGVFVALTPKCISGKGSCTGMAINAAVIAAGSFSGEGELLAAVRVEQAVEAARALDVAKVGGAASVRLGQAGEAAVRGGYDIGPKATVYINGRTRILDGLNDSAVTEVKNVSYQAYTLQLKDSLAIAQRDGLDFDLYVRGGANPTVLSRQLRAAVTDGQLNLKFIP